LTFGNEKWQTLDDYLNLIKNIRKQKDFEKCFDPIRLRTYLIFPIKFNNETVFMTGVRAYRNGDFLKAASFFQKACEAEPHLLYESKFNQATSLFKLGRFPDAHAIFNNLLIKVSEEKFSGKDRRLYYNKSVCELQMGRFDLCI
jgi:tetratricopeptide (TPR) repeat protein